MKYGLIGEKLGHSFSAEIHEKIADYKYELKEIQKDKLDAFMTERDFLGINVTIPYKNDVIKHLDFIEENAKNIGAVNTVVNKNGKLFGYNTDFGGLRSLIRTVLPDLKGKKALILGDGATSRTAFAVLESLNSSEILVVSRHPEGSKISYGDAVKIHNNASVIINATPVGMYPKVDASPISLESFNNLELVVDVIYNPLKTNLIIEAEKKGIPAVSGLYMLVAQAVLAAGYFMEQEFCSEVIEDIFKDLIGKKRNIVLTGMPGSGKTSIGKVLSKITGKKFIDTDDLIVEKQGMPITEIFKRFGEKFFRDLEDEVIKEVSLNNDIIISTGGGAILRNENITNLKHNGVIFFLDRELSELIPTADRPTANSKDEIIKRYNERFDIYNSTCDKKVRVISPEITANEILRNL